MCLSCCHPMWGTGNPEETQHFGRVQILESVQCIMSIQRYFVHVSSICLCHVSKRKPSLFLAGAGPDNPAMLIWGGVPYGGGSKIGTQNGPLEEETRTKTCGPFPGGIILSHTHMGMSNKKKKHQEMDRMFFSCLVPLSMARHFGVSAFLRRRHISSAHFQRPPPFFEAPPELRRSCAQGLEESELPGYPRRLLLGNVPFLRVEGWLGPALGAPSHPFLFWLRGFQTTKIDKTEKSWYQLILNSLLEDLDPF